MKGLKLGGKFMFVINSLVAFLLLISYVLPYIPPKSFATLSVLSLSVPLLIILNIVFFVYWLLRVKKQLLLSLLVLILGWNYIGSMYKFSSSKNVESDNDLSIMTYNVRLFNRFYWIPNRTVKEDIVEFVYAENPDVVCFQEYPRSSQLKLKGYNNFNASYTKDIKGGQVIYSKYPIVNSGSLEFPDSFNNGLYVDIVKEKDTLRIYTLHMQSSSLGDLNDRSPKSLFSQVGTTFKKQQQQVEILLNHKAKCSYKTIITGDFNNTAYSYSYKEIKGNDLLDAFEEAGNGFGRTLDFKFFPLRIDFILSDKAFTVNKFKTYDVKLSDHYPIKATLKLH